MAQSIEIQGFTSFDRPSARKTGGLALSNRRRFRPAPRPGGSAALLALLLGGLPAGCALPPACQVKPAEVEAARLEAAHARELGARSAAADSAEIAAVRAEIAGLAGQLPPAAEREPLRQRLLELKRGSGR